MQSSKAPCVYDVVIVAHNSQSPLQVLLGDIAASRFDGDGLQSVIVVDAGSSTPVLQTLAPMRGVQVISTSNFGFGACINLGVTLVSADYFVVLNPDVRIAVESLAVLVASADALGAFAVAPVLTNGHGEPIPLSLAPQVPVSRFWRKKPTHLRVIGSAIATECIRGAVMAMNTAKFRSLGGFETAFFLYAEEDDLILRASRNGLQSFIETRVSATHIGESSSSGVAASWRQAERLRGTSLFFRRHYTRLDAYAYLALELVRVLRQHGGRFAMRVVARLAARPRKDLIWPAANGDVSSSIWPAEE